ncbi:MAG: TetR/AcrR family transcriptional regulator, partial [Firmicutes bacterium]|nr:TetR/AcrR family transcriptional regulator [Bacillota bacterium]
MNDLPFTDAFKGGKDGGRNVFGTAAGVFAEKGYHKTTVDEIARAIGVAKGTVYYHFKNKEELYLAVIQEGVNLFQHRLRQAADSAGTPGEKIKNLVQCQLRFHEEEKDLVFLFLKELCGTNLRRDVLAQMLSGCLQIIRGVIEEGIKDGVFRDVDPEIATSSLFGMVTISSFHYIS